MNMLHYVKMPFSFRDGWSELSNAHPSAWKTFILLVLPFSLIAPLMLVYAGSHHGARYLMDASPARWNMVAWLFLITQWLTVPLMGSVIKSLGAARGVVLEFKDAFRLAALSAVPMWLSALGLAASQLWLMIGALLLGLFVAAGMLYHGSFVVLKMTDRVEAQSLSYQVFSVGGLVWALLCALVVLALAH